MELLKHTEYILMHEAMRRACIKAVDWAILLFYYIERVDSHLVPWSPPWSNVLIFYCCCKKLPQTEKHRFLVLLAYSGKANNGFIGLQSSVEWLCSFLKHLGKNPFPRLFQLLELPPRSWHPSPIFKASSPGSSLILSVREWSPAFKTAYD